MADLGKFMEQMNAIEAKKEAEREIEEENDRIPHRSRQSRGSRIIGSMNKDKTTKKKAGKFAKESNSPDEGKNSNINDETLAFLNSVVSSPNEENDSDNANSTSAFSFIKDESSSSDEDIQPSPKSKISTNENSISENTPIVVPLFSEPPPDPMPMNSSQTPQSQKINEPEFEPESEEPIHQQTLTSNQASSEIKLEQQMADMRQRASILLHQAIDLENALNNEEMTNPQMEELIYNAFSARHDYLSIIQGAVTLADVIPTQLKNIAIEKSSLLPHLRQECDTLTESLSRITSDLETKENDLSVKRSFNQSTISEIMKPVQEQQALFSADQQSLNDMINNARAPHLKTAEQYEKQLHQRESAIAQLEAQIEKYRREARLLKSNAEFERKKADECIQSFDSEQQILYQKKLRLEEIEKEAEQKIRVIEAPYQDLIDSVLKLKTQKQEISENLSHALKKLKDAENSGNYCETAINSLKEVKEAVGHYVTRRNITGEKLGEAGANVAENSSKKQNSLSELTAAKISLESQSKDIQTDENQLNELGIKKKEAVKLRNFSEAKKVNDKIKELQDILDKKKEIFETTNKKISFLTNEVRNDTALINSGQKTISLAKREAYALDRRFFTRTTSVLSNLDMTGNDEGSKMLRELNEILKEGFNQFKLGKQINESREELEERKAALDKEMEDVIAKDDFDNAAHIQDEIDDIESNL